MTEKFHLNIFNNLKANLLVIFLLALAVSACNAKSIEIASIKTSPAATQSKDINYFRNFKVISDTPGGLVFSVDYNYVGDRGDIRYGVGCLDKGLDVPCVEIDSSHFGTYHGASNGTFVFRLGLNGPSTRTTDQIYVGMYENLTAYSSGDLFVYQSFDYVKHWDIVLPTPTMVPTMAP